jgi:MoaA/NifB/PqqE/SkfB family radical SAM enzyme
VDLSPELLRDYNAARETDDPSLLCHFPWTTLNFDQWGRATACCYNRTHVLGMYPQDSLESIWFGDRARALRGYIRDNDFSHGCDACMQQIAGRNFHGTRARGADRFASKDTIALWEDAAGADPRARERMPKVFEFELQNTCNLECVMCWGDLSSAIRKNREKLPALASPYDAEFVRQLEPFLPHLREARFLGGEPFLIALYYDIWERIVALNPALDVVITTNGTVLKDRTKDVLERMNCRIVVSIDSLRKEIYERIRVNARFHEVMHNFRWLLDLVRRKGTSMSIAVCPMTVNWRELPDIVAQCNAWEVHAYFNTLVWPESLSLPALPREELREVHRYLGSFEVPSGTYVQKCNRACYRSLVDQVGHWAAEERSANVTGSEA